MAMMSTLTLTLTLGGTGVGEQSERFTFYVLFFLFGRYRGVCGNTHTYTQQLPD